MTQGRSLLSVEVTLLESGVLTLDSYNQNFDERDFLFVPLPPEILEQLRQYLDLLSLEGDVPFKCLESGEMAVRTKDGESFTIKTFGPCEEGDDDSVLLRQLQWELVQHAKARV